VQALLDAHSLKIPVGILIPRSRIPQEFLLRSIPSKRSIPEKKKFLIKLFQKSFQVRRRVRGYFLKDLIFTLILF